MALKPIEILINAKDEASAVFGRLQTKVAAVGVAIAGYFGIQAFGSAVKSAADFEKRYSCIVIPTEAEESSSFVVPPGLVSKQNNKTSYDRNR